MTSWWSVWAPAHPPQPPWQVSTAACTLILVNMCLPHVQLHMLVQGTLRHNPQGSAAVQQLATNTAHLDQFLTCIGPNLAKTVLRLAPARHTASVDPSKARVRACAKGAKLLSKEVKILKGHLLANQGSSMYKKLKSHCKAVSKAKGAKSLEAQGTKLIRARTTRRQHSLGHPRQVGHHAPLQWR